MGHIGKMDRLITIEVDTPTRGDYGEEAHSWATHIQLWAKKIESLGNEKLENEQTTSRKKVNWMVRYTSSLHEGMRINYNSNYYRIISIIELDRGGYMEIESEVDY